MGMLPGAAASPRDVRGRVPVPSVGLRCVPSASGGGSSSAVVQVCGAWSLGFCPFVFARNGIILLPARATLRRTTTGWRSFASHPSRGRSSRVPFSVDTRQDPSRLRLHHPRRLWCCDSQPRCARRLSWRARSCPRRVRRVFLWLRWPRVSGVSACLRSCRPKRLRARLPCPLQRSRSLQCSSSLLSRV